MYKKRILRFETPYMECLAALKNKDQALNYSPLNNLTVCLKWEIPKL